MTNDFTSQQAWWEWRPIETAPKDGTPVIVAWAGTKYDPSKSHYENGRWGELRADMGVDWHNQQPTHWMPMPPPPAMQR